MFEHLDDPAPFTPSAAFRAGARRRGRARRRQAWLARGGVGVVVAVAGAAAASAALVDRQLDRVDRVAVAGLAEEPEAPADPYTVLFVGSDAAERLAADDPVRAGREGVEGGRTDTMVLLRVDPAADRVTVLPLPRDLWVDVVAAGPGRLNGAYATGGPDRLVATVAAELGIDVNRYVELDLAGAITIGDAIGLRLAFDGAVRDPRTGLALEAGCRSLDGRQALALARSRHLEVQEPDGSWRRDPTSDLGRIERQQALGLAVLGSLSHLDATDPTALVDLLDVVARNLTVDDSIDNGELVELFRDLAGSEVVSLRLPVVDAERGGAQVLDLADGSDAVLDAFGAATPGSTTTTTTDGATAGPTGTTPTIAGPADGVVPVPC